MVLIPLLAAAWGWSCEGQAPSLNPAVPGPVIQGLSEEYQAGALRTARQQTALGDFAAAEATLRGYLDGDGDKPEAHALLGYVLLRRNQPKESLAEYTRAAQARTPTASDLRSVAEDYVLLKDMDDADHWMSRSLAMNDRDADTWYALGRIRYTRERFADAVQCFRKTLELSPESVKAADNLGLAYEGLNRTEDAVGAYRRALASQAGAAHPSEQPMLNLATVLAHQGKLDEALPLLRQALTVAPGEPKVHDELGHVYLQQNSLESAQREFEEAVRLAPKNGAYHFLLGQVYRRRGLLSESQAEFDRAAALNGTHSNAPER